jgi:proline dehydrogenase
MQLLRSSLLWASRNGRMERIVRSSRAMRPLVSRFMPGESLDDARKAVRALDAEGMPSILTYLGENVSSETEAEGSLTHYVQVMSALSADQLVLKSNSRASGDADPRAHISIKLTQFGWDLDRAHALERVRRLARLAVQDGTILAIDMESSAYTASTVDAYAQLAGEFRNVALCLQAYLHRTPADLQRLLPLGPYIRLVKGAYREAGGVALQKRAEIDARYRELARDLLGAVSHGARAAFGTHDLDLVAQIRRDANELGVPESAFEVQMLFGIQDAGRRRIGAEGVRTRVLISYGKAWYPWFMRRLAEKPSNLLLVARNLF